MRSVVDQVEGPPKTLASRRPIPMSSELATALAGWKKQSNYAKPEDWVFASRWQSATVHTGRMPFSSGMSTQQQRGRYYEADRLAQLPPYTGHPVAVLWCISKDDAGTTATRLTRYHNGNLRKGCDSGQTPRARRYSSFVREQLQRECGSTKSLESGHVGTVCSFVFPKMFPFGVCRIAKLLK
jgi:hypothetical protein